MINDDFIINEFSDYRGKISPNKTKLSWLNKHIDIKDYLNNRYPNDEFISYSYVIKRIFNHIDELPKCHNCGKKLINFNNTWCNQKCQLTDVKFIQEREKKINKKEIARKNIENRKNWSEEKKNNIIKKIINTKIQKYGKNFGKEIYKKISKTILNKYGVECVFQTNDFKNKSKETCLKKYGNEYFRNPEKIKKTIKEKYGIDNWMSSEEFKNKSKETCLKKYKCEHFTNKEKSKETCLKRYGVTNWGKTNKSIQITHSENINKKRIDTMYKNGTLNSSKLENKSYDLLKQKYPDVIHHYKDNRYPFNCDFYIPSLDLFIECQYGQFHHGRQYLETEEDIKDVQLLKEKAEYIHNKNNVKKSRYDAELETWTIRDVNKRKIAKQNSLNYIEFWNINELIKWIN